MTKDTNIEEIKIETETEIETKLVHGAVILQLVDKTLYDGDLNTQNGYPGTISFIDKENPTENLITCSKFGVTVGINSNQFKIIERELKDNRVFVVKILKFIPALEGDGTLSIHYGDMEAVALTASINGEAFNVFTKNDSRFGVK